jgi:hypothetical protein
MATPPLEQFLLNPGHLLIRQTPQLAHLYRKRGEHKWELLEGQAVGSKRSITALIERHGVVLTPEADARIGQIPERPGFPRA